MVVDDSAVIRGFLTRTLESDPDIVVVESVNNGERAVKAIGRTEIDVVILDIEMPVMDGLTALPLLLKARPDAKVIMASTLTRKNAAVSFKALGLGASDYIPKPTSARELHTSEEFARELVTKVKALATPGRRRDPVSTTPTAAAPRPNLYRDAKVVLRKPSSFVPEVIAIGSSTGGPQALFKLFGLLKMPLHRPILVVQHMPSTFTAILAEHIDRLTSDVCAEAIDGERLKSGRIYIAPGGYHMIVESNPEGRSIRLNQDVPENFCRPAVDPMFRSLAAVYGPTVLGVVLTGMGQDGLGGGRAVIEAGGTVIAQDESTSVVWGMPGAVATAGLCSATLPIEGIERQIHKLVDGGRR